MSAEDLAYRDELTGLYNRRFLKQKYEVISRQARDHEQFLSMLFIDVDYFKSINDRYGHEQGDIVLSVVARAIQEFTPEGCIPVRYAGDEFMVILPNMGKERAVQAGERILEGVRNQEIPLSTGEVLRQTLSVGCATYPVDSTDPGQLKELADEAVFISKKKGRNRVSTLDEKPPETLEPHRLFKYFPCRKFVGRAGVVGEVRDYLSPAPGLDRPCIIFDGPRGIGRSRLLDEIINQVDKQRTHLLQIRCRPTLAGQPFGELAQSLQSLFESDPERITAVAGMEKARLSALSPLLPALVRFGLVMPGSPEGMAAEELVESMGQVLARLAAERPMVIFLDDFQWCNQGTRLALEAARRGGARDMAVFATFVEDGALEGKSPETSEWLERTRELSWLRRLPLNSLGRDDIVEMMNAILPDLGKNRGLVGLVEEQSQGRPLLVEGLIRYLIDIGRVRMDAGMLTVRVPQASELPADLETILLPRLPEADPEIQRVLSKAAVMGQEFRVDVLAQLSGISEAELLDVLGRAEKAALVNFQEGAEGGVYSFHQDGVRQALYEGLSEEERRELHTATATVLEQMSALDKDAVLSSLARHWEAAGDRKRSEEYLSRLNETYSGLISPTVVEAYVGKIPPKKDWGVETTLTRTEMTTALRAARLIRLCLQNLAGYQSGSELVRSALDALARQLQVVLGFTEVLSFAEAEGRLMVNGEAAPEEESQAAGGPQLVSLLTAGGLRGMSFRRGVTGAEVREFLELVNMRPAEREARGGWDVLLKARNVQNVMTNERVYLAVGEKDLEVARRGTIRIREDDEPSEQAPEPAAPLQITDDIKDALQKLLQRASTGEEQADALKSGLEQLIELLGKVAGATPAVEAAPVVVPVLSRATESEMVTTLKSKADTYLLQRLRKDVDVLVMELDDPDDEIVEANVLAITSRGAEAVGPLITRLRHAESLKTRKTIFHLLTRLDGTVVGKLLDQLAAGMPGNEARHVVEVLHDAGNLDLGERISKWLRHPDPDTRTSLLALLTERPTPRGMELLMQALQTAQDQVLVEVIEALGKVRWRPAVEKLCELLAKPTIFFPPDKRVEAQKAAAASLGLIGDDRAVGVLLEAMRYSPFYTLRRNLPPEVRAKAALALCHFPNDVTKSTLVQAVRSDTSDMVRAACHSALSRINSEMPAKQSEPLLAPTE